MKKTLLWVVDVATFLGVAAVLIGPVSGETWAPDWGAFASLLVLGATAAVVVYYTDETRKMVAEAQEQTRAMWDSTAETQRLVAEAQQQTQAMHQPVCYPLPTGSAGSRPKSVRIRSAGKGVAYRVEFAWGESPWDGDEAAGWRWLTTVFPPGEELGEVVPGDWDASEPLRLRWTNIYATHRGRQEFFWSNGEWRAPAPESRLPSATAYEWYDWPDQVSTSGTMPVYVPEDYAARLKADRADDSAR